MKAVILAGGFGTGLSPLTEGVPTPCVPIVGVPCIVRTVQALASFGIGEIHVSLFSCPQPVRDALSDPSFRDLTILFHEQSVPLGTAGSVKHCLPSCDEEFLIVNGDSIFDFDLTSAWEFHRAHGGPVTLISSRREASRECGVLLADDGGRILRFEEAPDWEHSYSDDLNTGMYLCSPSFLELLPEGASDFSKDVFPELLRRRIPLYRYAPSGFWCDVGSVPSYLNCNRHLLSSCGDQILSAPDGETVVESPCYIGKNVSLQGCHIGPYTVIGDNCVLKGTRLEGCVLGEGVVCEQGSVARNAVLCHHAILRENSRVGDDCIVGADCEVGVGCTVSAGARIFPSNRIPPKTFVGGTVHHKLPTLIPEEGKLLFPYGRDFGGSMIFEVGRALAEAFDGDVLVGRGEQQDSFAAMTFCGGVLSCGKNAYDTGINELARFRFSVRNYAFRCGAFVQRNYSNLVLSLFDGNGMPLSSAQAERFARALSEGGSCGEREGLYRVFRGGTKSYVSYLKSFGLPSRAMLRVASSPALSPLLPRSADPAASERLRVGDDWVRVERSDGDPYDEAYLTLAACVALARRESPVFVPTSLPDVAEQVASQFGFRIRRIEASDPHVRKLFPLTDPNVRAILILNLLEEYRCTFGDFVATLPPFCVKHRDVSVSLPRGSVMRRLATAGGELGVGVVFRDGGGTVRIVPKQNSNAFRISGEAATAETAQELCDFYALKLKGLKPD